MTKKTVVTKPPNYSARFYASGFMKFLYKVPRRFLDRYDEKRDRKITGCSLCKYVQSLDRQGIGATGSKSTRYLFLDRVFRGWEIPDTAKVFDVGCGKGRVFSYLLYRGSTARMYGMELNREVAKVAQEWTQRYDNIHVSCGDVFSVDFNEYDILLLGRPFEIKAFVRFAQKLERELTHSVRVYYWCDQESGDYLNGRKGWQLLHREWIFRHRGLFRLVYTPQRYSVWTYTPQ